MKAFQRRVGVLVLLTLLISLGLVAAQDNNTVTVAGSGVVAPVFDSLKTASGVTIDVKSEVTGTRTGFERLCNNQTDIATSNRSISADESRSCTTNNIDYTELLIANNVVAFIAAPDASFNQCLTTTELNSVFAPSSQAANWNQVNVANADTALSVVVPAATTTTYAILDNAIEGDGIRTDAAVAASEAAVIAAVTKSKGAIGVVSLPAATAAGTSVKVLQVNASETFGCTGPSAETVDQRTYTVASPLFVYVNRASLTKTGLKDLLAYMIGADAAQTITGAGLVVPTSTVVESNKSALDGTGNSRPFSEATTSFQIPADASGQVTIAGAASGENYLKSLTGALTSQISTLTFDLKLAGQTAGVRRLCNGEVDIAVVNGPLTDEQAKACDANNIKTLNIELGKQAVVLVGNAASSYLTCLTSDQLAKAWDAASTKTVTNWNQVDAKFADQKMTLFAATAGDENTDILLAKASNKPLVGRGDIEINTDPLYRAAAVANVEGGLTYMSWADYQNVLKNNQERIQLVGVNAGNGCVTPSEETITNATYPLVRDTQLLVKTSSLTNIPVQSLLWFLASDVNYPAFASVGLIGVDYGSLPGLRQTLQKAYIDAATEAALRAEATPEATSEATAEATVEATQAAEAAATAEATQAQ
jgi:phosphate transport system substrate-binding protein